MRFYGIYIVYRHTNTHHTHTYTNIHINTENFSISREIGGKILLLLGLCDAFFRNGSQNLVFEDMIYFVVEAKSKHSVQHNCPMPIGGHYTPEVLYLHQTFTHCVSNQYRWQMWPPLKTSHVLKFVFSSSFYRLWSI